MSQKKPSLLFPLLLVLYEIATYLSNDMYLPALPQLMRELNLTQQQAQLTLTTWFAGQASLPLIMGVISDRYGRKPVLLISGIIYIIATVICALTTHFYVLMIARAVEGGMVAAMLVCGYACIHELYEQKDAIRILAMMGSIVVLAPALGPLAGSIVLYFTNWRGIFWLIAFLAFLSIALLAKFMPETHPLEKRSPLHWAMLFKRYGRIISHTTFMQLMMVLGFIFGGWITWITAGPLLIIENFHHTPLSFGLIQAAIFSVYILGNRCIKYLLTAMEVNMIIRLGLIISLIGGLLALVLSLIFPAQLSPFLGGMAVYSFGSALCFAPLNRLIIESSTESMGAKVAMFTVFLTLFAVLGSISSSIFFNGSVISLACLISSAILISSLLKMIPTFKSV
ncbi:MAG: multidrug effflux MFS transporter [Gammaproteobacteria bacterium]|nr:multidrug effflux MFS transporter [Gammaproteobacteria bacterium]